MSDTLRDEAITCTSCEYRYPRSKGVCAMCGTPAPAIEPLPALSAIPDELSRANHEAGLSSSDSQQKPPKPGLRRLIAVIVVSLALMSFALFFHFRKSRLRKEPGPAAELTRTLGQPKLESAGPRPIAHNSARGVQHSVAAKLGTAQATDLAKEDDPAELWDAVKKGSVDAEVALANLYLKGETVPQNCEQAHMLLLAASMKGSKFADNFLRSSYAERCE
jgi:TPR repeat protein